MHRRLKAAALGIAIGTSALLSAQNYTQLETYLPWTDAGQKHYAKNKFQESVQKVAKKLHEESHYTVLVGAPWCAPCRKLKDELHEKNLAADSYLNLDGNDLYEKLATIRQEFTPVRIPTPEVFPTLLVKEHGTINSYTGFSKYGMQNSSHNNIELEKLLRKEN